VELASFLDAIRARSGAKIILTNLPRPPHPSLGILDYQRLDGQHAAFLRLNQRMVKAVHRHEGVWILDLERLQGLIGYNAWFDSRMWGAARMPLSRAALQVLSDEMTKFLRAAQGLNRKCLVLDLDNTLWGGVLGEDGPEGIQLGAEYPGRAYVEFQEAILDLYHRGVILAINSKNNEAEARALLDSHPAMVLRSNHFATMEINWQSKVENMRRLAAGLNIGLDSMVFVDDSPVECSLMKQMLPEVLTVQLEGDPLGHASKLRSLGVFDTLSYSQEDRHRGTLYQGQIARERLRREAPTLEEFYRSLEMEITIRPVTKSTLSRAAQLTQRTNQFNLAPTRYSESEIAQLMESPDYSLFSLQLQDRFGDNGIVGLAITSRHGSDLVIEGFLLSCRVLGRMVETAFLAFLLDQARQADAQRVIGLHRPTKKNQQVADFYARHGFDLLEDSSDGTAWALQSAQFHRPYPAHFRLEVQR
ncbi:MAG: HAD-IIIC family phosphatase, partial [Chloroflexota bacterium]